MNNQNIDDLLLDRFDIGLLNALQSDAASTHQQLAEAIHLSASQVSRRVQRLQSCGLIQRQVALLNPSLLGLGVTAISYVTMAHHGRTERGQFEQDMAKIPGVQECYAVTGESDYVLKIVVSDLNELAESVLKVITRMPGVASVRSNLVLNCVKSTTQLSLAHLEHQPKAARQVRVVVR